MRGRLKQNGIKEGHVLSSADADSDSFDLTGTVVRKKSPSTRRFDVTMQYSCNGVSEALMSLKDDFVALVRESAS